MAYSSSTRTCFFVYHSVLLLVLIVAWGSVSTSDAFGTFGFDIHHRYSDPVKAILDLHALPEKGTHDYYAAMALRDRLRHGRRLAESVNSTGLTFAGGNETYQIGFLGFLHYANVSLGTPSLWFLVALDTGSNLFWLPCNCISCVHGIKIGTEQLDFNIYSPNTSSTGMTVPCNSTMCPQNNRCSAASNACPYQTVYLSNNTSSTGILVEDVLHLTTDDSQLKEVDARIKFGCGMIQTGSLLDGGAPNGIFGLGMKNISVPSILASEGLAANSFSMCFGPDGIGRIRFGDKGSSDQGETPFNLNPLHPTYNISMTQVVVGENTTDLDFTAIFDSGSSFTTLSDPAYSIISENFNSRVEENRHQSNSKIPFEYCYNMSRNETTIQIPLVNLTMKGGDTFYVNDPILFISLHADETIFCLGIIKSEDINIIGQNFMTGYHFVFDREKMVLGWKESNCYGTKESTNLPINPSAAPSPVPVEPPTAPVVPPTSPANPQATVGNNDGSPISTPAAPPPANHSPHLSSTCTLVMVLFSIVSHYMIILSS